MGLYFKNKNTFGLGLYNGLDPVTNADNSYDIPLETGQIVVKEHIGVVGPSTTTSDDTSRWYGKSIFFHDKETLNSSSDYRGRPWQWIETNEGLVMGRLQSRGVTTSLNQQGTEFGYVLNKWYSTYYPVASGVSSSSFSTVPRNTSLPNRSLAGAHSSGSDAIVSGGTYVNWISRVSMTNDTDNQQVGTLDVAKYNGTANSSQTHGYNAGGMSAPTTGSNTIEIFPFSNYVTSVDGLQKFVPAYTISGGVGFQSVHTGYRGGGYQYGPVGSYYNTMLKFPFAAGTDYSSIAYPGESIGMPLSAAYLGAGMQSSENGYAWGGYYPNQSAPLAYMNQLLKFPFAQTGGYATDVGDIGLATNGAVSFSSLAEGTIVGSRSPTPEPTIYQLVQSFPFANETSVSSFSTDANGAVDGLEGTGHQM